MTQPLAIVSYQKLLPGSQLVNRLQDLNYRVQVAPLDDLAAVAAKEGPMVILLDLNTGKGEIHPLIQSLRRSEATQHIPIIGFDKVCSDTISVAARKAGASIVVSDAAILSHLDDILQQALLVE